MSKVRGFETSAVMSDLFKIRIQHMPSEAVVEFSGYVTEFADQYSSNWNTETVYGRMDPLATFQNTQRQISLAFDVPSGDFEQAEDNLRNIDRLTQFLYPAYSDGSRSQQNTLKAGPLIGLKFSNLISNAKNGDQLLGYLAGVNYAPDMAQGGFFRPGGASDGGLFVPKVISISLQYTVLHQHLTGWAPGRDNFNVPAPGDPMTTFGGEEAIASTFPRMGQNSTASPTTPTGTPTGGSNTTQGQNAAAQTLNSSTGGSGAGPQGSDPAPNN